MRRWTSAAKRHDGRRRLHRQDSKFNGKINWIQLDQGADDHDHLISRKNACAWRWRGSEMSLLCGVVGYGTNTTPHRPEE